MKFKVREGFVCTTVVQANIGGGKSEPQESTAFGGQIVEYNGAEAMLHAHKLEPAEEQAAAWLREQHLPEAAPPALSLTPQQLQALALQLAPQLLAALQASTKGGAPGPAS